jgi:hypothetical protein
MNDRTIDGRIIFSRNAITNAMGNKEISLALAGYGYDKKRLQDGLSLCEKVEQLNAVKHEEYGEQYEATDALKAARVEANKLYMKHVKLARIAFKKERLISGALMLDGNRSDSYTGWLNQANVFYTNALKRENVLTGFALLGITREELEEGQARVKEVEKKFSHQNEQTSEAQDATRQRDLVFDDLDEWTGDLIAVSRIALEEKPQYLEMLGVVVKD